MSPFLVADIGGTNARFALVTGKANNEYVFEHIKVLSTSSHSTFENALQTYLESTNLHPHAACIAIAGPVSGDHIKMTNLSWAFSGRELSAKFGFSRTLLMNDFAAVASACSQMAGEYLLTVKPGIVEPTGHKAVFGPGTGLGVAGLINTPTGWLPVPTEGGHVNIAPATELEADVLKAAMTQFPHVSAEMFVSGPGLVNLYNALCAVRKTEPQPLKPSDITTAALDGSDELCVQSLELFVSFAGSFAGNLALTYGAKGGIYIAGGIMPRILDYLKASSFTERFSNKGVMSHYVEHIPVYLMTHPETAFVGAAAWLEQHL